MKKRKLEDTADEAPTTSMPTNAATRVSNIGAKTSHIKNKMVRSQKYHALKYEKNKEKKKLKKKKEKELARAYQQGLPLPPKEEPKTIENMREKDETHIDTEDDKVMAEEKDDEFAEHFANLRPPNVLITTSYTCSKVMYKFIADILEVFPAATYYKRKGYPLKKIIEYAKNREFTDLVVFNEDRKQVNGMIVVHLPDGPTAFFRLSSLVLSTDIKGHGRATSHKPELVLNNFDTMLGHRIGRMFASLFCQDPTFKGRRVVTFHNQRDFIFFRHHRYIFEEKDQKKVEKQPDGKMKKVVTPTVRARLQECGPRFTLKLEMLQKGTLDTKGDVLPRHWNMVNGLTMPAHTRIPLIIIILFFQNYLIIFVTKFLSIHEMKAAMSRAGIFLAVVFAVVSGAHAATNCSSADGRQIYKDGFQDTWLSGSQGAVLDDVSNVTIRPGTNMTLAAEIGAFSTFSMVTVMPFSTDSILDMWIQGTVVQDAMLYFESSESKVRSDSIDLSAISPESIAAADVLQDAVRIVGPDAADWFRLSVNTKILAPSNATETWDSIVFRDASGTGFSIFVSEAQILPNLPPCESRASSGCIGNVCNPVIDELFPQSDSVPLFGYGPIAQEISDEISAAGIRGVSLIAKLFKNITYAEVFEMCAKLQGQEQGSGPEDVFVTSVEILEARSTISPNVIAVCEIDATTTSLAQADIMAPVEWPLLTVRSYSFENITTMRAMVTTKVSYFDRDGIATTNSDDLLASTDAACPGIPWGLSRLDQPNLPLDNVFKPGLTGSGVHIYVLDTGVSSHSDFTGRIGAGVSCFTGTCTSGNFADANGHGTHVAGTAAGTCFGVAKKAIIHPVKVLSDSGSGSYSGIINGIKFAVQNSKNNGWRGVINMSLGGGSSASLNSAVNEAVSKGLVVAAAAGNDYAANACTKSPASAANALTVASVTKQDTASSFSNVGSCVDIWAPGTRVASASNTNFNGYKTLSGTSMATPHVAGAAALYLQKYPSASPGQVRQGLLKASVQRNLYPQTTTSLLQAYSAVF